MCICPIKTENQPHIGLPDLNTHLFRGRRLSSFIRGDYVSGVISDGGDLNRIVKLTEISEADYVSAAPLQGD